LKSVQEGLKFNLNILRVSTLQWEKSFHTAENIRPEYHRFKTTAYAANSRFKHVHNSGSTTPLPSHFVIRAV